MPDPRQIPYLIQLIDDESPAVRDSVFRELRSFGPGLQKEVARLEKTPTAEQLGILQEILEEERREWLRSAWPGSFEVSGEQGRLEAGLSLLAEFQNGRGYEPKLDSLLDQLAMDFRATGTKVSVLGLSEFLFQKHGLQGASQEDYYNPMNSNLVEVIQRKRGIPISLALVYILVGRRLGLQVEGCNFPGHFLTIASDRNTWLVVDCYNGGRVLRARDLERINATISLDDILRLQCRAPMILARVLRNLSYAYQLANRHANQQLMQLLLGQLEESEGGPLQEG